MRQSASVAKSGYSSQGRRQMEALASRQAPLYRAAMDKVWCAVTCSHLRFPGSGPQSFSFSLPLSVLYQNHAFVIFRPGQLSIPGDINPWCHINALTEDASMVIDGNLCGHIVCFSDHNNLRSSAETLPIFFLFRTM